MVSIFGRSRHRWQVSIALVLAISVAPPTPATPRFSDLQDHWAQRCIENLADDQIISGYPDGSFRPNHPVTRVEFAVMVRQAFEDRPPKQESLNFADISEDFWGFEAIDWATTTGFMVGYPDGHFRPNDLISRANVVVALVNGLTYPLSPQPMDEVLSAALVDWGGIPKYTRPQMATAILNQLVVNYPDTQMLRPNFAASRAEVAAFLCQSRLQPGQTSPIPPEYLARVPDLSLPDHIRLVRTFYSLLPNPQNRVDFVGVDSIALSPDGQSIAATTLSNDRSVANLMLWDVDSGTLKLFLPTREEFARAVVFHPDGQHLAYSRGTSIDRRYNLPAALPEGLLEGHTQRITDLDASADGQWLVSAGEDRQVQLWDWQKGTLIRTFTANGETEKSVAIDPKGQFIVSSDDDTLQIWELQTGKLRRTLKSGDRFVSVIALSPDGRTLASGGTNSTITLWNLNTGEPIQTLDIAIPNRVGSDISALAFSPDGQRLAMGITMFHKEISFGSDYSLQLWNVATGTQIASWQGHTDAVRSIVFTADSKTLISGSGDGTIKVWQVTTDNP
jgi:WD40 repeat protein